MSSTVAEPQDLEVKLVSFTKDPIETVFAVWQASRTDNPLLSIEDIKSKVRTGELTSAQIERVLWDVVEMEIPIARFTHFVFTFRHIPIALREQFVREKLGWEFWLQTMRVRDMSRFAERGWHHFPRSLRRLQEDWESSGQVGLHPALERWEGTLRTVQDTMQFLQEKYAMPVEDARELVPLAATHGGGAAGSLSGVIHTISKRTCWISQGSLWLPFITKMVDELKAKVHPEMQRVVQLPCYRGEEFTGCLYNHENERRWEGKDPIAVCPLWLRQQKFPNTNLLPKEGLVKKWREQNGALADAQAGEERLVQYSEFWGRDAYDGTFLSSQ